MRFQRPSLRSIRTTRSGTGTGPRRVRRQGAPGAKFAPSQTRPPSQSYAGGTVDAVGSRPSPHQRYLILVTCMTPKCRSSKRSRPALRQSRAHRGIRGFLSGGVSLRKSRRRDRTVTAKSVARRLRGPLRHQRWERYPTLPNQRHQRHQREGDDGGPEFRSISKTRATLKAAQWRPES